MNFSSPLASVCGVSWSEDGRLMATAAPPRISLWATSSCAVVAVFPCQELVQVCNSVMIIRVQKYVIEM